MKYIRNPIDFPFFHKFHRVAQGFDTPIEVGTLLALLHLRTPANAANLALSLRPAFLRSIFSNSSWTISQMAQYHTSSEKIQGVEPAQRQPAESVAAATAGSRPSRATLDPWLPESEADRDAILAQLDLLLAHPLFSQSKRYPALLQFVVEQALLANDDQVAGRIKERSIGIEVFGRPPGYDANSDPVVRITAGEVRKRLAQYYYDPANSDQIRIELPTGSYIPVFQRAPSPLAEPVSLAPDPEPLAESFRFPASERPVQPLSHHGHPVLIVMLVVVTLLLGLAGGYWFHFYRQSHQPIPVSPYQNVDDFWQPVTAGPATVTFCLGEPARDTSRDSNTTTDPAEAVQQTKLSVPLFFHIRQSGLFALADVTTLTRMTAVLERQHKSFRISAASEATYAQLREGPAVFIGAFDNLWTMRLTRNLRFGFDSIDDKAFIVDRKSIAKTTWFTAWDQPNEKLARDYAIVARYHDSLTGQPVVVASGISEEGTQAAGELISNPADLDSLLVNAPPNWRSMNMEAVIETQVIGGRSGPPQVRAVEFW